MKDKQITHILLGTAAGMFLLVLGFFFGELYGASESGAVRVVLPETGTSVSQPVLGDSLQAAVGNRSFSGDNAISFPGGESISSLADRDVPSPAAEFSPVASSPAPEPADTDPLQGEKVNVNTAGLEELMTLPGIGQSRGQAIIAYREENGPFTAVEQLTQVPGIGDGTLNKILNYITME